MSALKPKKTWEMQKCAPVQIWGQSVLEIHGSCDGISVIRWQPRGGSSEPTWAPSVRTLRGTIPPLRWRVTPWRWMGGSSQLLGGAPLAPPVDPWPAPLHRPAHLLAPPWHQGARMQVAREDNVRWGRRCADNQLKTFRTQEVSFAHNKSNWSPAHKPCHIVLLMVRPDSKTNFQKFLKHFLQWYPIWSYVTASLIRPIQFPILVPNYEGQEYCIKSKIF